MQCRACGQDNDPGLRFCVACGHTLLESDDLGASNTSDTLIAPGTVLKATYEIIRLLGEGGAGAVYEARHVDLGHAVAVKVLFAQLARIPQIRHRFLEEGRIQANLRHPNIVRVSDVVDDGRLVAMVMELVEGETLHDYIQRQRELIPVTRAAQIMLKLLAGLGAAHERDIVHRDIKPGNVMLALTEQGIVPKLCDFGIAKVASAQRRTVTGTKMGTLHYMAPEQFQDAARVDRRADVYAMGVTFFELLTRRLPFETENDYQLMRAHIELAPPSPKGMRPDLSLGLSNLVLKALAKKPADRFASCPDMVEALVALPELANLRGVASLPGVPISDDLIPPVALAPASVMRQRPPTRLRAASYTATPIERPRATELGGRASRPAAAVRRAVRRRTPWFPIFLGVFAAVLVAVVAGWLLTHDPSGSSAAIANDALNAPKDDEPLSGERPNGEAELGPGDSGATSTPDEGSGAPLAAVDPAPTWTVTECETLANEVADLDALHQLDDSAISELAERLDAADSECRERLVAPGVTDAYLSSYGQTQHARLRVARAVLRARQSKDDAEISCAQVLVARQLLNRTASSLGLVHSSPELHATLREPIQSLRRSVATGLTVLETRYLHCSQ